MAIDSKDKRLSVRVHITQGVIPFPEGVISQPDKAVLAWLYDGVQAAAAPEPDEAAGSEFIIRNNEFA